MSNHGNEPEYGQRTPPQVAPAPAAPTPVSPRAARRMARGLSFTVVMLGLLLGAGLAALGAPWGWAAGTLLAAPGAVGFVAVQAQLHPALRDPSAAPLRNRSRLWLVPAVLLPLGLLPLGAAIALGSSVGATPRTGPAEEYVGVLVVAGMTLVVAAGLGFGLVATASFTRPDDDDSPLRPTGYAERPRRPGAGEHYDPEWIHRGPRAGQDPGPPRAGRPGIDDC